MAQVRSEQDLNAAIEWADAARSAAEDDNHEDAHVYAAVSQSYSALVQAGALARIAELLDRQVNGA